MKVATVYSPCPGMRSQKEKDSEMKEARKGRLSEKLEAKTGDHSHVPEDLEDWL